MNLLNSPTNVVFACRGIMAESGWYWSWFQDTHTGQGAVQSIVVYLV